MSFLPITFSNFINVQNFEFAINVDLILRKEKMFNL